MAIAQGNYSPLSDMLYLIDDGVIRQAKDMNEWSMFMGRCKQNLFHRAIAKTIMWNGSLQVDVSTMFLGTNMNFSPDNNTPVLFESMVFNGQEYAEEPLEDVFMDRYSTPKEAAVGHENMIDEVIRFFKERYYNANEWDIATVKGDAHPDMWKQEKA